MPIYAHFLSADDCGLKVGQTDLGVACDQSSLVGLCIQDCQDYESGAVSYTHLTLPTNREV